MSKKNKKELINQLEFINVYFKDKPEFIVFDSIFDEDDNWIGQQVGDDFTNIDIIEENNIFYCKITSNELGHNLIAYFNLPENYKDFKTLLDIFLKG